METKQDQNLAGQTLNPAVPCPALMAIYGKIWTPKGLNS